MLKLLKEFFEKAGAGFAASHAEFPFAELPLILPFPALEPKLALIPVSLPGSEYLQR